MGQTAAVEDLAGALYDAAVEPERWHGAIGRIVETLGCRSGVLYEHDVSRNVSSAVGFHEFNPEFMRDYEAYYGAIDPWNARVRHWPIGVAAPTYVLMPDNEFRRTEYYQDFLRLSGVFYGLGGVVDRTPERMAVFGAQCSYEDGRFDPENVAMVGALMPHLRRAYRVHAAIRDARRDRETLEEALDAVPQPVLVVEGDARLVFANQMAKRLLAAEDGIRLAGRCVAAAHRADQAAFTRLLHPRGSTGRGGVIAALRRPRHQRHLLIEAMPLRQHGRWDPAGRIVLLIDVQAARRPSSDHLARLFDLTPAEARLWSGLADGATLAEIAARHRVSVNTLRVQLGRLFQKVGVHRQADLVRRALELRGADPGASPAAGG
jgi:DNA-binding CsgD family transcriptional regulator/PAS domain-containing protein